ncbi:MAG: DUF4910 domain-containing protein [Negativicutes bacterium]|nr:DUF4910 domain-containing protein [Negativicutes bacterium]
MIRTILPLIQNEFSGQKSFHHVAEVSQHHRIQASPGYRAAARYCLEAFRSAGVKAEILSYPADYETTYWTQCMFEEWECRRATLDLLGESAIRLCDFSAEKMSVIQRSIATPAAGVVAPIIWLEKGDEEALYPEIDFHGALVFSDGDWNKIRAWAVEKRGALGLISERMVEFPLVRHRFDIPDAILYTSFWWTGHEKQCFGFALSPKQGDLLKKLCLKQKSAYLAGSVSSPYLSANAFVDAKLYAGAIENVSAFIPGSSREKIILTAHLCHPQASANDNASGVGVLLETARTLQHLIGSGKLKKPKRGIRFLLVPEMTGTFAYLAQNEERIPRILAGLNLDMVGEKQELCQGPLVVEYPPQAAKSFVGDLMANVLEAVTEEAKNLSGGSSYALFKYAVTPFSGGSDHYVLSDPTVGIPSPMLIQWPDKFYHTSADTLDKVDPQMLYRVGCMSGTYAYLLANLTEQDTDWILALSRASYIQHIDQLLKLDLAAAVQRNAAEKLALYQDTAAQIRYQCELKQAEMADFRRFIGKGKQAFLRSCRRQSKLMQDYTDAVLKEQRIALGVHLTEAEPGAVSDEKSAAVPVRLFRGPFNARGMVEKQPAEIQVFYRQLLAEEPLLQRGGTQLLYWADGSRSVAEICRLTRLETGLDCSKAAGRYFEILAAMNLIAWKLS